MTDRSSLPASDIYNVDRWGDSYFRIDDQGQLCVRPNGEQGGQATLEAVLESCRAAGLRAPVLARFSGILRQRVKLLAGAFREAIEGNDYQGDYTQELIDETDYPSFDVKGACQAFYQWKKHKKADIMTFRNNAYKSVMTGTMAPLHHTPWKDALDDSMEVYLQN